MENTVIKFIVDNIWLFLPIGLAGIAVTLLLYFTGKRETPRTDDHLTEDNKTIRGVTINIYAIIYLIIWIVLIAIGLLSDFLIPTLVSGIISLIPLIALLLTTRQTKTSQER